MTTTTKTTRGRKFRDETGKDPVSVAIGAQVRARREALGMSQSTLGDLLDVSFQQIQKYEKGVNRFSAGALLRAAQALDLPAADLISAGEAAINGGVVPDSTAGRQQPRKCLMVGQIMQSLPPQAQDVIFTHAKLIAGLYAEDGDDA